MSKIPLADLSGSSQLLQRVLDKIQEDLSHKATNPHAPDIQTYLSSADMKVEIKHDYPLESAALQFLNKAGRIETFANITKSLTTLLGSSEGKNLASLWKDSQAGIQALSINPAEQALQKDLFSKLQEMTMFITEKASWLKAQKNSAQQGLEASLTTLNNNLATFYEASKSLSMDSQDANSWSTYFGTLQDISRLTGVTVFDNSFPAQGQDSLRSLALQGDNSILLTDHNGPHSLVWDAHNNNVTFEGVDITPQLLKGGGTMSAQVAVLQEDLVQAGTILDTIAFQLAQATNKIFCQGTSYVAQQRLEGATLLPDGNLYGQGTLRLAVTAKDTGKIVAYRDLDLMTIHGGTFTKAQLVTAIVDAFPGGELTAQLTPQGKLVIQANDPAHGISCLNLEDAKISNVALDLNSPSAQEFLGLNFLFQPLESRDGAASMLSFIPQTFNELPLGRLTSSPITVSTTFAAPLGDTTILNQLNNELFKGTHTFPAAAGFPSLVSSFENYFASVTSSYAAKDQRNIKNAEEAIKQCGDILTQLRQKTTTPPKDMLEKYMHFLVIAKAIESILFTNLKSLKSLIDDAKHIV